MPAKKNSKTTKIQKIEEKNTRKVENKVEKKKKSGLQKVLVIQNDIKSRKDDRMLEKVEKYVDKNREKTSQEMIERKSKRPVRKYQEWDLEVMISRISVESKPNENAKKSSKIILYVIYGIIIAIILVFVLKFFFAWNLPQIS